jgi:hypothetical protein
MAEWVLIPAAVSLRGEFNELSPSRSKASDGSIGDTSHSASSSDHNPDETGRTPYEDADSINEVHAIDVDSDLRKPGWSMQRAVNIIVGRHRDGLDDRLQNVIYNRKIASRSWGWIWRDYTGASPHVEHAHFGFRYGSGSGSSNPENRTGPWGLLAAEKGEDDFMGFINNQAELNSALTTWARTDAGQAVLSEAARDAVRNARMDGGDPAKGGLGDVANTNLQKSTRDNAVATRELVQKLVNALIEPETGTGVKK